MNFPILLADTYATCTADVCIPIWLFDDPTVQLIITYASVVIGAKILFRVFQVIAEIIPF